MCNSSRKGTNALLRDFWRALVRDKSKGGGDEKAPSFDIPLKNALQDTLRVRACISTENGGTPNVRVCACVCALGGEKGVTAPGNRKAEV